MEGELDCPIVLSEVGIPDTFSQNCVVRQNRKVSEAWGGPGNLLKATGPGIGKMEPEPRLFTLS